MQADGPTTSHQQMVKDLVRLALASEYSRTPLRRADITSKVMGTSRRQFRNVFDGAQLALRQTFGMELVELPIKEKTTVTQRRAAQKSGTAAAASKNTTSQAWILKSILPARLQKPDIITPPRIPTTAFESAYVGFYSFVIAVITLSGGTLAEAKLMRYLTRANANESTPIEKTDKTLAKMVKEGYIIKNREIVQGDETVDYVVGPRGKIEIGTEGTSRLVKSVYGGQLSEDLERRLEKSLKLQQQAEQSSTQQNGEGGAEGSRRTRPQRQAGSDSDEDD